MLSRDWNLQSQLVYRNLKNNKIKMSFPSVVLILMLLAVLGIPVSCVGEPLLEIEETQSLMGTYVTIIVFSDEETASEAINAAFARIKEIEGIASIFDEKTEVFRLNRDGYLDNPSDELLELLRASLDYNRLTEGSFDITCQPLLELWEYDLDADTQFWELDKAIQEEKINKILGLVDSDSIVIEDNKIYFKTDGMQITLGGIAKGYAVDEALEVIKGKGIKHALVNAGGDIGTLGTKPNGELWNIALVNPDDSSQSLATFKVSDRAIATSGNYERYFDPQKKVHHIMDPETGYSATGCISVTILAENSLAADSLATGVFVMGVESGMELVESLDDVECLIVDSDRVIHGSSGLDKYTGG